MAMLFGPAATCIAEDRGAVIVDPVEIRKAGLLLWIDSQQRDELLLRLARSIHHLASTDRAELKQIQLDFQDALLLATDSGVYESLAPQTIDAMDDALESVFDLSEIHRSTDWEPLIYAYGFFNRDVTPQEIKRVADAWVTIPISEREPLYPTYPHVIDAVCKPLAMGALTAGDTLDALGVAIPILREQLLTPVSSGRSFHNPSHASIVLAAMYDRWTEGSDERNTIERHLGSRDSFIELLMSRLVGASSDLESLPVYAFRFYAYSGRYIANALARLDARVAIPVLRRSIEVYEIQAVDPLAISYSRRALVALGDSEAREALLLRLRSVESREDGVRELVWLCRNGRGEGLQFGRSTLAEQLDTTPELALRAYFEGELNALSRP